MKKSIFIIFLFLLSFSLYGQTKYREIKVDSKTLLRGGDYVLISPTPGRITSIINFVVSYKHNTTAYTIASADSIRLLTDTPDGEVGIVTLSDSNFVKTSSFSTPVYNTVFTYTYGNDIKISIPAAKLTTGDGDLYIDITYELLKPKK